MGKDFGFTSKELPKVGEEYYIDEKQNSNNTIVTVKEVYGKIFCSVIDPVTGYTWDTMCNRLTKIKK
jgi:hypothetical protein